METIKHLSHKVHTCYTVNGAYKSFIDTYQYHESEFIKVHTNKFGGGVDLFYSKNIDSSTLSMEISSKNPWISLGVSSFEKYYAVKINGRTDAHLPLEMESILMDNKYLFISVKINDGVVNIHVHSNDYSEEDLLCFMLQLIPLVNKCIKSYP